MRHSNTRQCNWNVPYKTDMFTQNFKTDKTDKFSILYNGNSECYENICTVQAQTIDTPIKGATQQTNKGHMSTLVFVSGSTRNVYSACFKELQKTPNTNTYTCKRKHARTHSYYRKPGRLVNHPFRQICSSGHCVSLDRFNTQLQLGTLELSATLLERHSSDSPTDLINYISVHLET